MAPTTSKSLLARATCYDGDCYYSTWDNWGRWVALVLIVLFFVFLVTSFSSRRRRRRGLAPMYGTGWMGGKPHTGHQNQNNHTGNWGQQAPPQYQAPPPPYMGNQATGTTFQSHDGYYGAGNQNNGYGQQSGGIELQAPGASYQPQRGGDSVYSPPMGPPPGKGDGIIR
ncbi:hypothetical protein VTL71DRAFT_9782 [Oculimacula yallundae]|uniref:Uncharacterized protein n=1 Tax=Oculimacula yallundae TaxID=86028 RepID=A0ABR4BRU3_9HELO